MKTVRWAVLVFLLTALLSACKGDGKVGASDYLLQNISVWNGAIRDFDDWNSGTKGEAFFASIEERHGMKAIVSHMKNARGQVAGSLTTMEAYPYPADAADVHAKLLDLLKNVIAVYDVMLKMDALPDGFSDAQIQPLQVEYDRLIDAFGQKADALDRAQQAYADKHGISLGRG